MSQKVSAKNLTYDSSLPPFLARLRGQQQAERSSGPDPILAAQRRPGQKRSASEEAEDAPVVVDEEGNVVDFPTIKESDNDDDRNKESADKKSGEGDDTTNEGDGESEKKGEIEKEKVAGIGASRKRKVGRVVGEQSDEEATLAKKRQSKDEEQARIAKASADIRRLVDGDDTTRKQSQGKEQQKEKEREKTTIKSSNKKKAKKIKLSFGDDGD
jgi:hypothetical protein